VSTKILSLGILVGLALIAVVGLGGADGVWKEYAFPPIMTAAVVAVLLQWLGFLVAWVRKTEKFFDLFGSATFAISIALCAYYARANLGLLDVMLVIAVTIWAARLGSFLVRRVLDVGSDRRFNAIKQNFLWFLMTWTLQATWVVVTLGATLAVLGDGKAQPLGFVEICGLLLWSTGFIIEALSDSQKKKFRESGNETFIRTGLWSRSRHPNYFGEIVLWTGLTIAALPSLSNWQYVTLSSPVFVWLLLMKISGAPMLEAKAERRWGTDPEYIKYRSATPLLVPRLRKL
tara:strand:+ start:624 stop:1490 length:867 start_codon:yes stop_codon:yes gene_type:complete